MKLKRTLFNLLLFFTSLSFAQQTEKVFLSGIDVDAPVDWELILVPFIFILVCLNNLNC